MKSVKKPFFSLFLLCLFTLYQTGTWMFTHVHEVNGRKITHSHPYTGMHDHTAADLIIIGILTGAETSLSFAGEDFIWLIPPGCKVHIQRFIQIKALQMAEVCLLRAPPCFSL